MRKIGVIFEDPKYSDTDKDTREKIANLMQQVKRVVLDVSLPPAEWSYLLADARLWGAAQAFIGRTRTQ